MECLHGGERMSTEELVANLIKYTVTQNRHVLLHGTKTQTTRYEKYRVK
jgi:hypothetical protein